MLEEGNTELKLFSLCSFSVRLLWLTSLNKAVCIQIGVKYLADSTHFCSIIGIKMLSIHLFLCLALEVRGQMCCYSIYSSV